MSELCLICQERLSEQSIRDHIVERHGDHAASVEDEYPDLYRELFDGDELVVGAGRSGGDDSGPSAETGDPQRGGDPPGSGTDRGEGIDRRSGGGDPTGADQSQATESTRPRDTGAGGATGSAPGSSQGGTASGTRTDPATGGSGDVSSAGTPQQEVSTGKKWLMLGIGGAGNNIMDAVLMRRDTLREQNDPLAAVWDGGLADYGSFNTNIVELGDTYYAQVDRGFDRQQLLQNGIIALGEHDHMGAGTRWEVGRKLAQLDFEGETNPFIDRWTVSKHDIQASQAVMLVHSVTKGTGCGATPVIAENIREMTGPNIEGLDDAGIGKPILSSVVLPSDNDSGPGEQVRGVVGMSYLAKAVDAIIPFDNEHLDDVDTDFEVEIDEQQLRTFNPHQYVDINKLLVAFLEAFTLSSTPQMSDQDATADINGETFDVPDSFRPVEVKYPADAFGDFRPAVVMAPVLGRSHASTIDRSTLDTLARTALLQGQLIEFDPSTAWGGTFMIYGPQDKMEDVAPLVNTGELTEILSGEDFLARDETPGGESIDIYTHQLVVPHLDGVYLWGLVWNPRMPSLDRMYQETKRLKEQADSRQAETLRDRWDVIEPLFECLGRENMG